MTHDEVLMLIISGAVIVEIVATFGYLKRIPHPFLLLGSFGSLVVGCIATVTEGFIWAGPLNVLEHLAMMAAAVLFALWCGLVFGHRRQESP